MDGWVMRSIDEMESEFRSLLREPLRSRCRYQRISSALCETVFDCYDPVSGKGVSVNVSKYDRVLSRDEYRERILVPSFFSFLKAVRPEPAEAIR